MNDVSHYTCTFEMHPVRRGTFYVWAEEALELMHWEIQEQDEQRILAAPSSGESLQILLRDGQIFLESTSDKLAQDNVLLFLESLTEVSVGRMAILPDDLPVPIIRETEWIHNPKPRHKIRNMLQLLIPRGDFIYTPVIIVVCLFIFLMMASTGVNLNHPSSETLLMWGASINYLTLDGEWWRTFSSMFVHPGMLRMLFNLYAFLIIGLLLEPVLGRRKFLLTFIITGVAASFSSLVWHSHTIVVGLSGAVFGLYGVLLALVVFKAAYPAHLRKALLISAVIFITYNLLFGNTYGVDYIAHLGGLISGFILGSLYSVLAGVKARKFALPVIATLAVAVFSATYIMMPRDMVRYQKAMAIFEQNETLALQTIGSVALTNDDHALNLARERGIALWEKNINLLKRLNNMPPKMQRRVNLLLKYSILRKEIYSYMMQSMQSEDGTKFQPVIAKKSEEMRAVVMSLRDSEI